MTEIDLSPKAIDVDRGETVTLYGAGPAANWSLEPNGHPKVELIAMDNLSLDVNDEGLLHDPQNGLSFEKLIRNGWLVDAATWNRPEVRCYQQLGENSGYLLDEVKA